MDRIRTAAATGLLLSAAVLAPAATAEEQGNDGGARTTQQPVAVVMDYSESMLEKDADEKGTARIDAAKEATKALIEKTPKDAELGMVAFGHADRNTCTKIETLQQVGPVDKKALTKKVDALGAQGGTPIGQSLQHAADELADVEGEKSIILVSDGEPTCDEPPACEVAEQLADQGIDLTVHTIGFRLQGNAKAQETLECIAEATGGTYTDADDADALTQTLTVQATRAFQGYQAAGTPITGGDSAANAPVLKPGRFVDEISAFRSDDHNLPADLPTLSEKEKSLSSGDVLHYRVPVHEGYAPVLSATVVQPPELEAKNAFTRIWVRPLDPDTGATCPADWSTGYINTDGKLDAGLLTDAALGTVWQAKNEEPFHSDGSCLNRDGTMTVGVATTSPEGHEGRVPLELSMAYRPTGEVKGEEMPAEDAKHPEPGRPTPVAGGSSFNDATVLKPGQTIEDDVLPRERRYFAIDAEPGQAVGFDLRQLGDDLPFMERVKVVAANPLRQDLRLTDPDTSPTNMRMIAQPGDSISGTTEMRLWPGNASSDDELKAAAAVPGRQFVVVMRDDRGETGDRPTAAPFELTLDVDGEVKDAGEQKPWITTAAQYTKAFGSEEDAREDQDGNRSDGDSTEGADESGAEDGSDGDQTDGSAGPTEDAEDASGPAEEADSDASPETAAGTSSDDGGAGFLPWALGGAGVVALVGGLLLATRRRA